MVLPIYLYGSRVLHEETEDIDKNYPELEKLIEDMFETMYKSEGVGLAAPQIGRSISVFVIDGSPMAEHFPECKDSKMVFINPMMEILDDQEPVTREEGCLSLPGMGENVKRVEHIRMNWLDIDFREHEEEFSGFLSRIIQHEYDHLLGTVYTDHVSGIRKQLIKSKLNNISQGRVRCDYPVRVRAK